MAEIHATTKETFKTVITNGNHRLISDEPISIGGTDEGFTPGELLSSSLASCSTITMRMYANRKGWKVDQIDVSVVRIQGDDADYLRKRIKITGDLNEEQCKRMEVIAGKCPVHKLLVNAIEIRSEVERSKD